PGPAVPEPSIRVRVPVMIDGAVRCVLAAPIRPTSFVAVLRAQPLQPEWSMALLDRNRRLIARIPDGPLEETLSAGFSQALERAPRGWFPAQAVGGERVYAPYVTSQLSGWVLGLVIPARSVEGGAWRTFEMAAGGALAALVSALGVAWVMAHRIAAPITRLARATEAMGRGEGVDVPDSGHSTEVILLD